MRIFSPLGAAFCLVIVYGCATTPPPAYDELLQTVAAGEDVDVANLKRAFIERADFNARMQRLATLEQQALQLIGEEPLKLGPIGTAILDQYYGSLAGHLALASFYEDLDDDSAAMHRDWGDRISGQIESESDGTREEPYRVLSATEAQAYLIGKAAAPVGSMYHSTNEVPFMLMITAKPESGRLQNIYFDLEDAYDAIKATVHDAAPDQDFTPGALIGFLARRDDSAAQAFIGTYLATEDRLDEATQWLSLSTRTGNVVGNLMLARVWWTKARELTEEAQRKEAMAFVMENYLQAIAVGSDEAMYNLGALYLNGRFGEENESSGIPLMQQAADLENTEALVYLAQIYFQGTYAERNLDLSESYYVRAARLDDDYAKLQYARFLTHPEVDKPFNRDAYDWLREVIKDDNPEAMVLMGNLFAKGVYVDRSFRRAKQWFKRAVDAAPDVPSIINEVAWTLAVSNLERLRSPAYALTIMDGIMERDQSARQTPAYLDTWAAAYAANGQFERAAEVQREAVQQADAQQQTDVIEVLREHLEAFEAGEAITDAIP